MKKKTTNLQPVVKPHDPRLDTIVGDAALNVPGLKNLMHNKVADEDKRLDALLTAPPADPDAIIAQAKAQRTTKQAPATPAPAPAASAPAKAQPAPANPATVAAKSPVAPNPAPQPATPAPTAQPAAPAQQVAPAPAPQTQPVATPATQTEPIKSVQSPVVVAGSKATVAIDRKEGTGMNGYLYGTYGRGVFDALADAIETADRGQGIHPLLEETILHLIRSYPDLRARTAEVRPSYAWKYMGKKGKLAGKIFDSEEEARHAAADFLEVGVAFKDLFVKDLFYADDEGRATDHKVPVAERDEYLRQLEFVKFKRGGLKPHSRKAKEGSTKSKDDAGQEGK